MIYLICPSELGDLDHDLSDLSPSELDDLDRDLSDLSVRDVKPFHHCTFFFHVVCLQKHEYS